MDAVTTGYFGKLPSHADFVSSGLSDDFVVPWDQMIRRTLMTPVEAAEGGGYVTSEHVCASGCGFVIQQGLCGPSAWLGAVMPSRDRVGRTYPFTLGMSFDAKRLSASTVDVLAVVDAYCALLDDIANVLRRHEVCNVDLVGAAAEQIATVWNSENVDKVDQVDKVHKGDASSNMTDGARIDWSLPNACWWSVPVPAARALTRCSGLRMPLPVQRWMHTS
jgi:type VI secretion system ImpM family protein